MNRKIDEIDSKILVCLQKNGRMSYKNIAKTVSISEATARSRVNKLLEDDICQIVAVCDPVKIGFLFDGNIRIRVIPNKKNYVIDELKKIKEVWYVAQATGNVDINIEFYADSLESLNALINDKVNTIEGIISTETTIILKHDKRRYDWGTSI